MKKRKISLLKVQQEILKRAIQLNCTGQELEIKVNKKAWFFPQTLKTIEVIGQVRDPHEFLVALIEGLEKKENKE